MRAQAPGQENPGVQAGARSRTVPPRPGSGLSLLPRRPGASTERPCSEEWHLLPATTLSWARARVDTCPGKSRCVCSCK